MPSLRLPAAAAENSDGFLALLRLLFRHKFAILLFSIAGCALGILIALPQRPVYQARVSLEIQGRNEDFLNAKDVDPTAVNYSAESYLQTQIKILESQSLMDRVIRKLESQHVSPGPEAQPALPTARLFAFLPSRPEALDETLQKIAKSVSVRGSGMTRMVEVFCESTHPALAAAFANTLANEYVEQDLEARWASSQRTTTWLTGQLRDLKAKLEQSEQELRAMAQGANLVLTGEKDNLAEQKLKQFQEELVRAQTDRVLKQSRYELAKSSPPESLPEVLDDASLREYQNRLADLHRDLAGLLVALTPEHPKVVRVQQQIVQLDVTLRGARTNILRRITNEYETAARRESLLQDAYLTQARLVSEQSGKAIQYDLAKHDVDSTRTLYDSLLQKVREAGIASAMRATAVRVVDSATPPDRPVQPNPILNSAIGLFAGAFMGIVFAVSRDRSDRTFKAPGEVTAYLAISELGSIPTAAIDGAEFTLQPQLPEAPGELQNTNSPAVLDRRSPLFADSCHAVLASILFSQPKRPDAGRTFVVTSAGPGDGKTLASTNLAVSWAKTGAQVLLVDADLRKPRLGAVFELPNAQGLSDYVVEEKRIRPESLVHSTAVKGLSIITSGNRAADTGPLLFSPRMMEFLLWASASFDGVLIDTPPMLQLPDARLIARGADGAILVVRAGHTPREMAQAAVARLEEDGIAVLGAILNDWDPKGGEYYGEYLNYLRKA